MAKRGGAVHVTTHRRHYVGKDGVARDGVARDYETHLLRRSWREDGKVHNETVANLSHLPTDLIEVIRGSLAGQAFVPASAAAKITGGSVALTDRCQTTRLRPPEAGTGSLLKLGPR